MTDMGGVGLKQRQPGAVLSQAQVKLRMYQMCYLNTVTVDTECLHCMTAQAVPIVYLRLAVQYYIMYMLQTN